MIVSNYFYLLVLLLVWTCSAADLKSFSKTSKSGRHQKLLLFVSITSAPAHSHLRHAIRNTWLLPCIQSLSCDYRFFLDSNANHSHVDLHSESETYQDLVFRDSCPLMDRHPSYVNYGNSPPVESHLHHTDLNRSSPTYNQTIEYPDYPARRLYKVDWKTCFLKHTAAHYALVLYHIFVEDDSFVCMKNMLYQLTLLQYKLRLFIHDDRRFDVEMPNESRPFPLSLSIFLSRSTRRTLQSLLYTADTLLTTPYDHESRFLHDNYTTSPYAMRTGTFMYDGFDDSSTLMNHRVAQIFNDYYPTEAFHCANILDTNEQRVKMQSVFLSWGNSWMAKHCNWSQEMLKLYKVRIVKPIMTCHMASLLPKPTPPSGSNGPNGQQSNEDHKENLITLPCVSHPLILHHHTASNILLIDEPTQRIHHLCDYLLLVDKVKSPQAMQDLYTQSCVQREGAEDYHDFTDLFFHDNVYGWEMVLYKLQLDENDCQEAYQTEHTTNIPFNYTDTKHQHMDYPCLFALPKNATGNTGTATTMSMGRKKKEAEEEGRRSLRRHLLQYRRMQLQRRRRRRLAAEHGISGGGGTGSVSYEDYFDVEHILTQTI